MNSRFTKIAFAVLLCATMAYGQAGKKTAKPAPSSVSEFKSLVDRNYDAWNNGKPEIAAQFYSKNPENMFFDLAPLKYQGWEEYKRGVQTNLFDNMTEGKITPNNDLKVTRHGSIAWTTVTMHYNFKMKDGKKLEGEGRHTAIWEKQNGKWLIVHEHMSAPLQ